MELVSFWEKLPNISACHRQCGLVGPLPLQGMAKSERIAQEFEDVAAKGETVEQAAGETFIAQYLYPGYDNDSFILQPQGFCAHVQRS